MRESWLRFATSDERGRQVFRGERNGSLRMPIEGRSRVVRGSGRPCRTDFLCLCAQFDRAVRVSATTTASGSPCCTPETNQGVMRHDRYGQRPDE
jgi:hypothetical protein